MPKGMLIRTLLAPAAAGLSNRYIDIAKIDRATLIQCNCPDGIVATTMSCSLHCDLFHRHRSL